MTSKKISITWSEKQTHAPDSIRLAAQYYGLKVSKFKLKDFDTASVNLIGPENNINAFQEAFDKNTVEPMHSKIQNFSHNEYLDWLSNQLRQFGVLFIPEFIKED